MACELTKGRALDCRDGIGGIKAVYFVQLADITTFTTAAGVLTELVITSNLFKYNLARGTGSYTESVNVSTENGTLFFQPEVNIKLHKMTTADQNELKLLAQNRRLVIFVETNNVNASGKRTILCAGGVNGMELTAGTVQSGVAFGDMNGYDLTFTGMEPDTALVVEDYTTNPFDQGDFTVNAIDED